jgi:hypothetical protein
VLAQGVALAWAAGEGVAAIAVSALVAGVCAVAWMRRLGGHADVLIASVAFGGLGMMIGEWIARAATHPAMDHPTTHGAGTSHGPPSMASWMIVTGVMLITCAAACRWSCAPLCRGGWRRRTIAHLLAAAAMVGGMAAADALLSTPFASLLGAAAGMHVAMVLGMAAGVALVLPLVARLEDGPSAATPP